MSGTWTLLSEDDEVLVTESSPFTKDGLGDLFLGELPEEDLTEDELEDRVNASIDSDIPDPGWDAMTTQLIRASCAFTAQELLTGPPEPPYNGKFLIGDHHVEWDDKISKHKRLCILASRDHGKSHFMTVAYGIWMIINNPRQSGFIFSATQIQAEEQLGKIREEIETNPKLQWLIPENKKKWGVKQLRCANGHKIYARGFGTKVRGSHPVWICVDDGLTDETQYSEMIRRKQKDYFLSAISNMVVPGGQIVVIGCVAKDTWVLTGSGYRRIGDLNPGPHIPGKLYDCHISIEGRKGIQTATKYWVQGEVPTKKVVLEYGYRLESSYRHPYLVMGKDGKPEWKRADELDLGDMVAVKYGMNRWGDDIQLPHIEKDYRSNSSSFPSVVTEDLAYFVGLWTAEGSYEASGRVMISNNEEPIRDFLRTNPFGMRFKVNTTPGSTQTMRCSSLEFLKLFQHIGGHLGKASTKVVPSMLMSAPRNITREFLRGLFDGDGSSYCKGSSQSVLLSTTSENLAYDVQLLLLNFGILSSVRVQPPAKPTKKVPQGGNYPLYSVAMSGSDAYLFMNIIGFRLKRKQRAADGMKCGGSRSRGIPNQSFNISLCRKEKPRRKRSSFLNNPPFNIGAMSQMERPLRESLKKAADWFYENGSRGEGHARLTDAIEEDQLAWLKVKKIENSESFTVDFVIEGDHSFLTNGIVSHNTPLHEFDLYALLRDNPKYHYAEYPAESHPGYPDNKALWPDRYNLEYLEGKRIEIGEIPYTREFLVSPISDGMSLFPVKLFQGQDVERFNLTLGMPLKFWQMAGVTIYMGVDFAISSNVGADYTVVFVMGSDKYGNRWIIDIHRAQGMPYQQQLSLINKVARKYEPVSVYLESNQMQTIFGDELIRTSDLPIHKFHTGVQKHSLDKGVPSLRVLLENGKFRIPRGDAHSIEMTDVWINEMRSFTYIDGKLTSVGGHDDVAMACYICDQAVRTGGFAFSFGDEEKYEEMSMDDILKDITGEKESDTESTEDDTDNPATEAAKNNPAIHQGYVPFGCTMSFSNIMSYITEGMDPCDGCSEDRSVCKGRHGGVSLV